MNANLISTRVRNRPSRSRGGFTLVEMMAVIVIIGILASILLGALSAAAVKSKEARTKSLISKMHNMIMARWDAYRTIRLPISTETSELDDKAYDSKDESVRYRQNVARRRLFALRELMVMEMPDRYDDLDYVPYKLVQHGENGQPRPVYPYLRNAYQRKIPEGKLRFEQMNRASITLEQYKARIRIDYQSAECLYLILTTGIDDSSVATEHFTAGDAGDKDGDGMLEFHDAWGNPIGFIRWAPGVDSPAQPLYRYPPGDARYAIFDSAGNQPKDVDYPDVRVSRWQIKMDTVTGTNGKAATRMIVIDQDEPLNPLRVGPIPDKAAQEFQRWLPGKQCPEYGFLLMPFIYSYGRDLRSGIEHCLSYTPVEHELYSADPTYKRLAQTGADPYVKYKGPTKSQAAASAVGPDWYRGESTYEGYDSDNIHNHEMVLR